MTAEMDRESVAALREDNRRLRRLLDQHDAPGELRHRLRSTLAMLRATIRQSAETGRPTSDYVAHLEDRLDTIARAQALADLHGDVDLRTLLADELFQYGASEGERLLMSGPDVRLQPRTGQILALAIHELAVNAVEHGALGKDRGRLDVSWSVDATERGTSLLLSWTEDGTPAGATPARTGFGTEVLTRMIPYELEAETDISPGPTGLRCTIRFPLPGPTGQLPPD